MSYLLYPHLIFFGCDCGICMCTVHTYGKEEEKAEAEVDALVVETAVKRLFLI